MKSVVTVIPTIGHEKLTRAIDSVLGQSHKSNILVVIDGPEFVEKVHDTIIPYVIRGDIRVMVLPENVGGNGYYSHRVYAAIPHLVNEDYILFLDEDNFLSSGHIQSLVDVIENSNDWSYSLRNIWSHDEQYICEDKFESVGKYADSRLGYELVDTSCYCLKREVAEKTSFMFNGKWGQDRVFYEYLSKTYPKFDCTFKHTLNYQLGSDTAAKPEFFIQGNQTFTSNW